MAQMQPVELRRELGFHRMLSRSMHDEQSTASTHSEYSTQSADVQRNSLPAGFHRSEEGKETVRRLARQGSDTHLNERYYAALVESGQYVKSGWLTKQGHMWKNWKTRFFVLFHDGAFAYYKAKGKRKMKGCIKLNDGVVSIQHVDVRRAGKVYVFQVEKGFYKMWCMCNSQMEAEVWVQALRSARISSCKLPCYEALLTAPEEQQGFLVVSRHLNKIFITDERVKSILSGYRAMAEHSLETTLNCIMQVEDTALDRYNRRTSMVETAFESVMACGAMSGNELVKLIRRHVEDRVFTPFALEVYAHMELSKQLRNSRATLTKNLKLLKSKPQRDFGVPDELAQVCEWKHVQEIVNSLECVSLPAHKIELILTARETIMITLTQHDESLIDVSDESISCIFRFILASSTVDDLAILLALLEPQYKRHPACQNQPAAVGAFLDAIKWLCTSQVSDETACLSDGFTLASSRVVVSISTPDVGVLFTTDSNGRGALVSSVRKLSQAALSEQIQPGLSLIAVNDEPVMLMPFREICNTVRSAKLPKRLTFMTEFCYYQLLDLDVEMYHYLMCLAASRGDRDSVAWLLGASIDLNELCRWESVRGKQVFGFTPPASHCTPLHAAAIHGQASMVEYLLRVGSVPDVRDHEGRTAIHVVPSNRPDMPSIPAAFACGWCKYRLC
ncbi:hypothetical protein PINS_up000139 [Pythium insidiosum]|nr:hypothetical protein PINS_up000139 [Pythium insidiosum]